VRELKRCGLVIEANRVPLAAAMNIRRAAPGAVRITPLAGQVRLRGMRATEFDGVAARYCPMNRTRSPVESETAAQGRKPRISVQGTEGWLRCAGEARGKLGLTLRDGPL